MKNTTKCRNKQEKSKLFYVQGGIIEKLIKEIPNDEERAACFYVIHSINEQQNYYDIDDAAICIDVLRNAISRRKADQAMKYLKAKKIITTNGSSCSMFSLSSLVALERWAINLPKGFVGGAFCMQSSAP